MRPVRIRSDGTEFVNVTMTIQRDLYDAIKARGIKPTATFREAMIKRIAELERAELAGNKPATSSTPTGDTGGTKEWAG